MTIDNKNSFNIPTDVFDKSICWTDITSCAAVLLASYQVDDLLVQLRGKLNPVSEPARNSHSFI
jgi:hypothetical protein